MFSVVCAMALAGISPEVGPMAAPCPTCLPPSAYFANPREKWQQVGLDHFGQFVPRVRLYSEPGASAACHPYPMLPLRGRFVR
jgi:hypothetical protein